PPAPASRSAGWKATAPARVGRGRAAGSRASSPSPICFYNPPTESVDSLVSIPRAAAASLVFLRTEIPRRHPSAAVLGEARMGAGVAVAPDRVLTAHYLVLGASKAEVTGVDGRPRTVARISLDHESGLALLALDGHALRTAGL